MAHTAKKISAGEYEYRGWAVSKCWSESYGCFEWFIQANTHEQGRSNFDPTATLRDAKVAIDYAIEEHLV